jgi:eukaryotic-like serine/threonine-protein kinase
MQEPVSYIGDSDSESATRDFQDRLGHFARTIFVLAGIMLAAGWLSTALLPDVPQHPWWSRMVHLGGNTLAGLVWLVCRGKTLSRPLLETIDAGLTLLLGLTWVIIGLGAPPGEPIEASILLASTYTALGRSVTVPSTFGRTFWVSTLTLGPTAFFIFERGAPLGSDGQSSQVYLLFFSLWCCVGVAMAALNSRRIYGLRERLREMSHLGQYTLAEKIGEGGMGVVYRAHHSMLRRPAAIKLLLPGRASELDLLRFEREVQLTSQLSHPNTVSIFDYGRSADGAFYYVMEYLDGLDLDRLVDEEGPIPAPRVVRILAQVSGALGEAHSLGLIHRDIKPANLILTARVDEPDVVKVVDFGLVRPLDDRKGDLSITHAGVINGTPMYLAPESITDAASIDGRADIYAVGAVGYYLLTGRHVFEASSVIEMCAKHLGEVPVPPSKRVGRPIASDLEQIILSCLAKSREERPASAGELRAALLSCADATAFDEAAARRWWSARRARLGSTVPMNPSRPPTMAIQWTGRND